MSPWRNREFCHNLLSMPGGGAATPDKAIFGRMTANYHSSSMTVMASSQFRAAQTMILRSRIGAFQPGPPSARTM